jgi:integrase
MMYTRGMSLYRRNRKGRPVWYSRIIIDGVVHQFSTGTENKNTARSIEAAKRNDLVLGKAGLTSATFGELGHRFINSLFGGRVAKETRKFYIGHYQALEQSALSEMRLDKIDVSAIENFVQWRRKQNVTATSINHNLRTLRRALRLAVEWNMLSKVPKITLLKGEVQREYVLPEAEVRRFADIIGQLVRFLVDTGLRRRECLELEWRDVNTAERFIQIRRSKTKYGRRKIPMTKRVEEILSALPRDHERVWTRRGRPLTIDWISHAFLRERRRLQLPEEAVLHCTRHTFCTRLGEKGADAFAIQRLAGHSSIIISQRYVHPSAGKLDAAIALLD